MTEPFGIDFGTTYSSICQYINGQPQMLTGKTGNSPFFPTIMAFEEGQWLYGIDAVDIPGAICDIKRMLGVPFDSPTLTKAKEMWKSRGINIRKEPQQPHKTYQGIQIGVEQSSGDTEWYSPEDLAAKYIEWLYKSCIGENPTGKLAVSYPAKYNQYQKDATREAYKKAGFSNIYMISEPSAAGLAIANNDSYKNKSFENMLICDFGGGTLDVTLMKTSIFDKSFTVSTKVIDGDQFLGGRDIDNALCEWTLKELKKNGYSTDDEDDISMILQRCTVAKESLSQENVTNYIILPKRKKIGGKALDNPIQIDLTTFNTICQNIFDKISVPIQRVLDEQNITKDDVDGVLLVGGSSQNTKVQQVIEGFLGKPVLNFVQKRECIAQGACLYAAIQTPGTDVISYKELEEKTGNAVSNPVEEKLAHSLGTDYIEIENPDVIYFSPILVKNLNGPGDSITKTYRTMRDNQDTVHIGVYECDTQYIEDANLLKEYQVENITPKPKYEAVIEITFFLDTNGLLIVTSREKGKDPAIMRFKYILNHINQTAKSDGLTPEQREVIRERDIYIQLSCLYDFFEDNPILETEEFKKLVDQDKSQQLYDEIEEALNEPDQWTATVVDDLMSKGREILSPYYNAKSLPLPEQFGMPE